MKQPVIYQIINKINGRSYIGSTINIDSRKKRHLADLRANTHHSIALQRAYIKYGISNLMFEVLEECSRENMLSREQYYLDSLKPEYNLCKIAGNCLGVKHSEETKRKRREASKKYWDRVGRPWKESLAKRTTKAKQLKEIRSARDFEIIELIKGGMTQTLIATKYNLSPSVVTQIKRKNGIITAPQAAKGSNNGFSKLTEGQVREIKGLLDTTKYKDIATMYNVKERTIKAIKSGQNWSHITI